MTKKLRIIGLLQHDLLPPESLDGLSWKEVQSVKTEYDVVTTLEELGHDLRIVPVDNEIRVIREAIEEHSPHIAFNLLEGFAGFAAFDQHVVSFLELLMQPYTGCNPRGLTLARDKALSKKILHYHRIRTPGFAVAPLGQSIRQQRKLRFPLMVKSLIEEGSVAIAHASVVSTEEELQERAAFIHHEVGTHAICEEFIEGREIYVGVIGNKRLTVLPPWEFRIQNLSEGAPFIATDKLKWDEKYREKVGADSGLAQNLSDEVQKKIARRARRIYRALGLSGYARMDFRLTENGELYLLEANPNPELAYGEDFAESAEHTGISYPDLLQRIINLGLRYDRVGEA